MPDDNNRPWWDRALDVLRYEAAAFRLLLWTIAVVGGLTAVVLVGRAIF